MKNILYLKSFLKLVGKKNIFFLQKEGGGGYIHTVIHVIYVELENIVHIQ